MKKPAPPPKPNALLQQTMKLQNEPIHPIGGRRFSVSDWPHPSGGPLTQRRNNKPRVEGQTRGHYDFDTQFPTLTTPKSEPTRRDWPESEQNRLRR